MRTNRSPEHPNDEMLLAYLDDEMSMARICAIRNHLKSCWKCRSALADLELQAEAISRLSTANLDSEIDRSTEAKEKVLRWRKAFENRRQFFLWSLPPQLLRNVVCVPFAQTEADPLLSLSWRRRNRLQAMLRLDRGAWSTTSDAGVPDRSLRICA
jgi:anti-sigma factor RsiW